MTIVWEQSKKGPSVLSQMLMSVVLSGLVSMACNLHALREHREQARHSQQLERKTIKSALSAVDGQMRKTRLATSKLQHELALLTADNGIIKRVIAHLQVLRVENATLSQHLAVLQTGTLRVLAGTASAAAGQSVETRSVGQAQKPAELTVVTPAPFPQRVKPQHLSSHSATAGADGTAVKVGVKAGIVGG